MGIKLIARLAAVASALIGVSILALIFYPILVHELKAPPTLTFLSPIPDNEENDKMGALDYTKASSWFPKARKTNFEKTKVSSYRLSISRLNIKNAIVSIGGEDLSQSLIQYPGTAIPGQIGNTVIFGHSVLPAFYNPSNYLTIFSTIPTLVKGDVITLDYDGITYKYEVEEYFEVDPSDIQILNQDDNDSYLTLVTCVPPGLTTRRGIIRAKIVPVRST